MRDVVLSLVSSVIAGAAVWLGQRLLRYRKLARARAFFGVTAGRACLLVSPRSFWTRERASVHGRDMVALVELASMVHACGGRTEMMDGYEKLHRLGRTTEFCVGGPAANPRTAAHLRALLPGVRFEDPDEEGEADPAFTVGSTVYRREVPDAGYAILARTHVPDRPAHPVFLIAGQRSWTNIAAARYLTTCYRQLLRRYGTTGRFCLVLRVREPDAYGPDYVEEMPAHGAAPFQEPPET